MSLGLGLVFVPVSSVALFGVAGNDSGVASAMINSTQQVGGSIGTALLNTIATSVTASYILDHGKNSVVAGTVHGFSVAYACGAGLLLASLVVTLVLINARREDVNMGPEGALAVG